MRCISLFVYLTVISCFVYSQNYQVLFIGNSYTYTNDLPATLYHLAASAGDTMQYDSYAPGGYTFEAHSTDANSIAKINSRQWDFVVLQDQSQRPSFPDDQLEVEVFPFAQKLDSLIHKNDRCSETVFFMTWGRKYGDASNCASWPPVCTFEGMNDRLRYAYLKMADSNQTIVAPVGVAWRMSRQQDSTVNLWSADNSHPSIAGTYLSACVFYAILWHKDPRGNTFYDNLGGDVAGFLQEIAFHTVFDSLQTWNIGEFDPWSEFDYLAAGNTIQYNNHSLGAENYFWNFGDGQVSSEENPEHTYAESGMYEVCLSASDSCNSRVYCQNVDVVTGITNAGGLKVGIYPNPCIDRVTVSCEMNTGPIGLKLRDITGKEVLEYHSSLPEFQIGLEGVENGVYWLEISNAAIHITQKLIVGK